MSDHEDNDKKLGDAQFRHLAALATNSAASSTDLASNTAQALFPGNRWDHILRRLGDLLAPSTDFHIISVAPNSGRPGDEVKLKGWSTHELGHLFVYWGLPGKPAIAVAVETRDLMTNYVDGLCTIHVTTTVPDLTSTAAPTEAYLYATGDDGFDIPRLNGNLEVVGWEHVAGTVYMSNRVPFHFAPPLGPTIDDFSGPHDTWYGWNVVNPSRPFEIRWMVRFATRIEIKRVSAEGPDLNLSQSSPNAVRANFSGSQQLPAFQENAAVTAIYELTAYSDVAPPVSRRLMIKLRAIPFLSISGVEVTQAIQHCELPTPNLSSYTNSVRLVAKKRTLVRVYVSSGIESGFDNGSGPSVQPHIKGWLRIESASTGQQIGMATLVNGGGEGAARHPSYLSREHLDHSVNFLLPTASLSGRLRLAAHVYVDKDLDGASRPEWRDVDDRTVVEFQPRYAQSLVRVRVRDDRSGFAEPTLAACNQSLTGARVRFPVSENGLVIYIAPGNEIIGTDRDLTKEDEWQDLLDDIEDIADDYSGGEGVIWTALVPDGQYAVNGISYVGSGGGWGALDFNPHRCMVAKAGLPATFAHELAHTYGVGHAPCGDVGDPDSRLPAGIEDVGIDTERQIVLPAGTSELMSYCVPSWPGATYQDRWISIALWELLFDAVQTLYFSVE